MALTSLNYLSETKQIYWVLKVALILFFISDILNRIFVYYNFNFSASVYVRGIFEFVFLFFLIIYSNRARISFILTILILFCIFLTGLIFFRYFYTQNYNVFFHISAFNKYIFVFIIYQAIYKLQDYKYLVERLITLLENIFVINSVIILIGALFQIDLLRSYPGEGGFRFGYIGFIPAVNEATLFYLIAISLSYYRRYILGISSIKFYIITAASLLLGTKAIYLIIISLLLLHFLRTSSFKTKVTVLSLIVITFIAINAYLSTEDAQIRFEYFYHIANKRGLFTMLLSGRDLLFQERFYANISHWGILNYIAGGQDQLRYLIEMDFFDLFLFFGSLGSIIYISLFFSSLFTFKKNRYFNLYFILIYFLIAGLGGHFFASALNALYLAIFCIYIKATQKVETSQIPLHEK